MDPCLNSAGAILSTHAFDAFGSEISTPATSDPFGYGAQWGYYTDRETGLLLLAARYHGPGLARFLTRDPSGYVGGLNRYAYAANDPSSYVDPGGDNPLLVTGAISAGVGAIVGGVVAWHNGGDIWAGIGGGAVLGGVAGLTGGFVGEAVLGWIGGSGLVPGALAGFRGGAAGNVAQQGVAKTLGRQRCVIRFLEEDGGLRASA